jgi:hypothetical protein
MQPHFAGDRYSFTSHILFKFIETIGLGIGQRVGEEFAFLSSILTLAALCRNNKNDINACYRLGVMAKPLLTL